MLVPGTELARYDLREDFSIETNLIFAELYRHDGEWKFRALGQGSTGEIDGISKKIPIKNKHSCMECLLILRIPKKLEIRLNFIKNYLFAS